MGDALPPQRLGLEPYPFGSLDEFIGGAASLRNADHTTRDGGDHRYGGIPQERGVAQIHHDIEAIGSLGGPGQSAHAIVRVLEIGHELSLGETGDLGITATTHDEPSLSSKAQGHELAQLGVWIGDQDARGGVSGHGPSWHVWRAQSMRALL